MSNEHAAPDAAIEREWPEWIDEVAIDPTGEVWGFEGGCHWDGSTWMPVDGSDGLRFELLGCERPVTVEAARTLHFRHVREIQRPMPTDDIELERNRYYVAEVELFPGNPRHRAIIRPYVIAGKRTEIELLSYEDKLRRLVKNLHFFRVICEIGEMR